MTDPAASPGPRRPPSVDVGNARFVGLALTSAGVMIALLCGACSAAFLAPAVEEVARTLVAGTGDQYRSYALIPLATTPVIGVLPAGLGVVLALRGQAISRGRLPSSSAGDAVLGALAVAVGGPVAWFCGLFGVLSATALANGARSDWGSFFWVGIVLFAGALALVAFGVRLFRKRK